MTDLDVTMAGESQSEKMNPPSSNDKRLIDNLKFIPEPHLKEVIEEVKEVFDKPTLEVKPVISDKVVFGDEEEIPSPPAKKQVASEKQREHLKKAREKALETRRAKSAGRKKLEEEKKVLRQQKREEKEKVMIEAEDKEHVAKQEKQEKVEVQPHSYMKQLSEEEIVQLQQKAIENYEVKRKANKKIKKEEIAKENADKKIYESISKAVGPVEDAWDLCFR